MARTTYPTIRVTPATHRILHELSEATGESMTAIVAGATYELILNVR